MTYTIVYIHVYEKLILVYVNEGWAFIKKRLD